MMTFSSAVAWGIGLWLAAGIGAASGCGAPGPMVMVAIAAGFSAGMGPGAVLGAVAGLGLAALGGAPLFPYLLLGALLGVGAALFSRLFARHNLFMAVLVAFLLAAVFSLANLGLYHLKLQSAFLPALWQSLLHALWMVPIYGIVLLVSPMRAASRHSWE